MREGAKKRLTGAVVLVALAVIFVPMLFEPESLDNMPSVKPVIPRPPAFEPVGRSEVFLGPQDSGVGEGRESGTRVSQPIALPPVEESPSSRSTVGQGAGQGATTPSTPKPPALRPPVTPVPGTSPEAKEALPSWVIQVASVPTAAGADDMVGKLRAGGFSAYVEQAEVNGKVTYRVKVGPELDRARAEQTAARLREKHKVNPMIKSYP
jgi:DedD protein